MRFVQEEQPDFFCVQETKCQVEQLSEEIIHPMDLNSYWSCAERKGYSGVATYTKTEFHNPVYGIGIKKFDGEGRIVTLDFPKFKLYNIYFPNGGASQERHNFKQEFLKNLYTHLQEELKKNHEIIVVGDYNIAPLDIDVYNPTRLAGESGFLPEERAWFKEFLDLGFVDTYRHFYPEEKHVYTWWSMLERGRLGNRGWRIDHICITKGLLKGLKEAIVFQDQMGSDHCPVGIVLEL